MYSTSFIVIGLLESPSRMVFIEYAKVNDFHELIFKGNAQDFRQDDLVLLSTQVLLSNN